MIAQHFLRQPRQAIARMLTTNRPLALVGLLMIVTLVGALIGLVVDHQVITGAPAWLKPAKFAISIAIYSFTFVWLLGFVQGHPILVRLVAWITALGLVIEMILIAMQVVRGTTSHFNVSTPFDTAVWSVMGGSIVCVWTANLILGILLLRQRLPDPAFAASIRWGVFLSLVGMGVAFFMTTPTAQQRTTGQASHSIPIAGAHTVGVPDGGAGLPILGWSTVGGDLRVPHFVGLHALQLLPIFGWLLARYAPMLRATTRRALIRVAGFGYLGLIALLTWQALRSQSLVKPDGTTLLAFAALIGATTLLSLIVLTRPGRSQHRATQQETVPA